MDFIFGSRKKTSEKKTTKTKGKKITQYRRHIYTQRIKKSLCRRIKTDENCNRFNGCKYASGTKRRFCRKKKSKKI